MQVGHSPRHWPEPRLSPQHHPQHSRTSAPAGQGTGPKMGDGKGSGVVVGEKGPLLSHGALGLRNPCPLCKGGPDTFLAPRRTKKSPGTWPCSPGAAALECCVDGGWAQRVLPEAAGCPARCSHTCWRVLSPVCVALFPTVTCCVLCTVRGPQARQSSAPLPGAAFVGNVHALRSWETRLTFWTDESLGLADPRLGSSEVGPSHLFICGVTGPALRGAQISCL